MKRYIKKIVFFSASILLVSFVGLKNVEAQTSVKPVPFSDISRDNPYYEDVIKLHEMGLIQGDGQGNFRPKDLISRAEFLKLVLGVSQCMDCSQPPADIRALYQNESAPFPDVSKNAWYFFCVSQGKQVGIITGYLGGEENGLFVPEDSISRAESLAVLLRAAGISSNENDPLLLEDTPSDAWYVGYVKQAVNLNIIPYNNGFIRPEEKIQRDEFAHLVGKVLTIKQCTEIRKGEPDTDGDGVPNSQDDCPDIAGPKENNGCPYSTNANSNASDRDGDGVLDHEDACPDVPGIRENAGCPLAGSNSNENNNASVNQNTNANQDTDDDGDGIGTSQDDCPNIPGNFTNVPNRNGCPILDPGTGRTDPGMYVYAPVCRMCPCPEVNFTADIRPGDVIFTAIMSLDKTRVYSKSNLYYVTE